MGRAANGPETPSEKESFGDVDRIIFLLRWGTSKEHKRPFGYPTTVFRMPRRARVIVPSMAHHVVQRGSRRFNVFRDESDRLFYLNLFRESCAMYGLAIRAYSLMPNHVHYVAVPELEASVARTFHRAQGMYSKWFNEKHGYVGHLWQERPFSCVLSEAHTRNAIRYVENNPVRAGMVSSAEDFRWSSARAHCFGEPDACWILASLVLSKDGVSGCVVTLTQELLTLFASAPSPGVRAVTKCSLSSWSS